MGRCHEFGTQIRDGCDHPMRPGDKSCNCPECGVVCGGQFDGCPGVWAKGLRPVAIATRALRQGSSAEPEWDSDSLLLSRSGNGSAATEHAADGEAPAQPPNRNRTDPGSRVSMPQRMEEPPNARIQLFRWFESEFGALRGEVEALMGTVTQQQAMIAELLENRHVELRLALLAESLPEALDEAVRSAVSDNIGEVVEGTDTALQQMRESLDRAGSWMVEQRQDREEIDSSLGDLRASVAALESVVDVQRRELQGELARLRGLKASMGRQLRPITETLPNLVASAVSTVLQEHRQAMEVRIETATQELQSLLGQEAERAAKARAEADERHAAELRSIRSAFSRQLRPLAVAVEGARGAGGTGSGAVD